MGINRSYVGQFAYISGFYGTSSSTKSWFQGEFSQIYNSNIAFAPQKARKTTHCNRGKILIRTRFVFRESLLEPGPSSKHQTALLAFDFNEIVSSVEARSRHGHFERRTVHDSKDKKYENKHDPGLRPFQLSHFRKTTVETCFHRRCILILLLVQELHVLSWNSARFRK